jgi:hypothetical protein
MNAEIVPISFSSKKDIEQFIDFQWEIYRNDPAWVPPLKLERRDHINPKVNPYFEHAEMQLFLAKQGGKIVGRISANRNFEYDKRYGTGTGFFGLFECINDLEVAKALVRTAEEWCKARGCTRVMGPFSHSINDECGFLIKGFQFPPYVFMPHNPEYYPTFIEALGYSKIKDLIAWRYDLTKALNDFTLEIASAVRSAEGLIVRDLDMNRFEDDFKTVLDIYNEAWEKNWGYVPFTEAEAKKFVKDAKLIIEPRTIKIAEVNGEPAAVTMMLPNLNEVIKDLNGAPSPLGLARLLWRAKVSKSFTSGRLIILGIRKKFRGGVFAGGSLSVLLYVESHRSSQAIGWRDAELGWTLEDNEKINLGIQMMGGDPYKLYRIYSRDLVESAASPA